MQIMLMSGKRNAKINEVIGKYVIKLRQIPFSATSKAINGIACFNVFL